MTEKLSPIYHFGPLQPLRNARLSIDGVELTIDLIPQKISDDVHKPDPNSTDVENRIRQGAREIIESENMLRLVFDQFRSLVVSDEFCDAHPVKAQIQGDAWPRIEGSVYIYPFFLVENSAWLAKLPDYQGGDYMKHYMIVNQETAIDILAFEPEGTWIPNPHSNNEAGTQIFTR